MVVKSSIIGEEQAKSFLKWAGGKSRHLPLIKKAVGFVKNKYIEPFLGSAVVAMNIKAPNYVLSDINVDLINTYLHLKWHGKDFIEACRAFFAEEFMNSESYYELREIFNNTSEYSQRAVLFVYLNRMCYNGLCRYNSKGEFNVPYGKQTNPYFPLKEMRRFYKWSKNVDFMCFDFRDIMMSSGRGDVIYCDPPYIPRSLTSKFTSYDGIEFTLKDHQDLVEVAINCKAKVVISNNDTIITRDLYKRADKIISFEAGRFLGATSSSRKPVEELIAIYKK